MLFILNVIAEDVEVIAEVEFVHGDKNTHTMMRQAAWDFGQLTACGESVTKVVEVVK
jgi:hypothetical protein